MPLPYALRQGLSSLLAAVPVRLKVGPNQDCRWSLPVSGRYRTSVFEGGRIRLLNGLISEGDCVWDIGAHHGYVALIANRNVGPTGKVYAFEPSRYNFRFLSRHLRWNDAGRTQAFNVGIGASDSMTTFGVPAGKSSKTYTEGEGSEQVMMRSMASLLEKDNLTPPTFLKVDVEGGEGDAIRAMAPLLRDNCVVVVSIHSHEAYASVRESLGRYQFECIEVPSLQTALASPDWLGDPELIGMPSGWSEEERSEFKHRVEALSRKPTVG